MNEICNESDETIMLKDADRIEEVIIEGIYSIRKNCSRPSHATILSYINNGDEFNLNVASLKRIMNDMLDKGNIYVKGKKGMESFYVSKHSENNSEIPDNEIKLKDVNILENIMCDEFYNIFVNKVKDEVLSHINIHDTLLSTKIDEKFNLLSEQLKLSSENKDKNTNDESNLNTGDDIKSDGKSNYDVLITTLKEEITFLRNELRSKDKIIELIVKESNAGYERNVSANNNCDFEFSKKSLKRNNTTQLKETLPVHNKFSSLEINKNSNDVSGAHSGTRETRENTAAKKTQKERKLNEKKPTGKRRVINFIGDSILKDMNPYNLKQKISKTDKLYIQSYRGARTSSMKYHAKATQQFQSDVYVLHCGTNDLKLEKSPEDIATDILEIGEDLKIEGNKVFISGILTRRDDLDRKGKKVNDFLSLHCPNYSLGFIDNNDIITNMHLNQSGLHLNKDGTRVLSENFLTVINT